MRRQRARSTAPRLHAGLRATRTTTPTRVQPVHAPARRQTDTAAARPAESAWRRDRGCRFRILRDNAVQRNHAHACPARRPVRHRAAAVPCSIRRARRWPHPGSGRQDTRRDTAWATPNPASPASNRAVRPAPDQRWIRSNRYRSDAPTTRRHAAEWSGPAAAY
ncbi:hypothetical protein D3C71_1302870 [compost metagenome]